MALKILCAAILLACILKLSSTQTSCRGRCGTEYYRGYTCQCDYNCLLYNECCPDYESQCTTKNSCKGRCGQEFKRGRLCSCDPECVQYKQCCPDFTTHCDEEESALTEAAEELSISNGNNADVSVNLLDDPTSYPPDSNDLYSKGFPSDDSSNSGVKDQEVSPDPDSSSGYGASTTDPLDEIPTEVTVDLDAPEFTTETAVSVNSGFSDQTTMLPQTTPAADPTYQPASSSEPEPDPTTSFNATENETTVFSLDKPEVTTINTQDSNTVLENSPAPTSPPLLTSTASPEENTSDSKAEDYTGSITTGSPLLADLKDPSTSAFPGGPGIPTSPALVEDETTDNVTPEITTADLPEVTSNPNDPPTPEPTSKPQEKPDISRLTPSSKPDTKPLNPEALNPDNTRDFQADDSNDTNLCSGQPISGVTTLGNGTIVVFRGHYFWFLDREMAPSPPQSITQVWGVPSPIDTVFTRCNCQGKTYIFKGGKYWRFENDILDSGYPKLVRTGFDGLKGHITAALSVPQYQTRKESVYFFKRGGFVQKYSYLFGTSPRCGKTAHYPIYTVRARKVRQAASILEPAINIQKSWGGFPPTITAAVSVPSSREPEGYKYFVFSRSTTYRVRMDGERPVTAAPSRNVSPQTTTFFKCPQKA